MLSCGLYTYIDFPDCDGSPCQQMCVETDGSYQCSCTNGYLLANDRRACNGRLKPCDHYS